MPDMHCELGPLEVSHLSMPRCVTRAKSILGSCMNRPGFQLCCSFKSGSTSALRFLHSGPSRVSVAITALLEPSPNAASTTA